jgi:hypothetical protein
MISACGFLHSMDANASGFSLPAFSGLFSLSRPGCGVRRFSGSPDPVHWF